MDLKEQLQKNSFCRFLFDYLPTTYYYYYYNVLVPHKQTLILYIKVEIKPKMFLHEKNDDTKNFIKFSKKHYSASSAAWQNSREFNRHYCEFIKSFHTNKTLKVKGIFEFTLDHDLWKMPVPGHPTLYIHTTKVEFDKPDKTENKQKK